MQSGNLAWPGYESAPSHAVGCLFEQQERVGTNTIEPRGAGRRCGLHELPEGFHAGDFHDQLYRFGFAGSVQS